MSTQDLSPPIVATFSSPPPRVHRFTVDQYHRMGNCQAFSHGDHVELLYGLIVDKHTNGHLHCFSVEQYHRLIAGGVLTKNDKVELIEGQIIAMTPIGVPHRFIVQELMRLMLRILPDGWDLFVGQPITLAASEPQPDLAVVRGKNSDYRDRNPGAADVGLVIEVADSSVSDDRTTKSRLYAAAGIAEFWLVDVANRQVEIRRDSRATESASAAYQTCDVVSAAGKVVLVLDGLSCGEISVAEIWP